MLTHYSKALKVAIFITYATLIGCTTLEAALEGEEYPQDTPIIINGVGYQINTIKCAEIRSIRANGDLECFDKDGKKSASIPSATEFQHKLLKEHFNIEWGSEEHFVFLYRYHHESGKEDFGDAILGMGQAFTQARSIIKTSQNAGQIPSKTAALKIQGVSAYAKGGLNGWTQHQFNITNWHLSNARNFGKNIEIKCNPILCPSTQTNTE